MKTLQQREEEFKRELEPYKFSEALKQDFFDYWTEPNKSKTKMRYEQEKTWDMGRRLRRWESNNIAQNVPKYSSKMPKSELYMTKNVTNIPKSEPKDKWEELDLLLLKYTQRFESVEFTKFGEYYDFIKEHKMMRQFTKEDIDLIKVSYNDNFKCRCACVKMTFDAFVNAGINFSYIKRLRNENQY